VRNYVKHPRGLTRPLAEQRLASVEQTEQPISCQSKEEERERERERQVESRRGRRQDETGLFFRTAGYSARNSDAAFAPGAGLNYRAGEVGLRGSKRIKS